MADDHGSLSNRDSEMYGPGQIDKIHSVCKLQLITD